MVCEEGKIENRKGHIIWMCRQQAQVSEQPNCPNLSLDSWALHHSVLMWCWSVHGIKLLTLVRKESPFLANGWFLKSRFVVVGNMWILLSSFGGHKDRSLFSCFLFEMPKWGIHPYAHIHGCLCVFHLDLVWKELYPEQFLHSEGSFFQTLR